MSSATTVLALWLDGPMQAWGHQSRFKRRTTLPYPTRSGVIGLVSAALGLSKHDVEGLAAFRTLSMETLVFPRYVDERPQPRSRWIDFQTVGGGFDKKRDPASIVRKVDGRPGDTVVTFREYLSDSRFGVLLSTDERSMLERIQAGLRDPRWGIWLGRKCCIPAAPIEQGLHESRELAASRLQELAGGVPVRRVVEAASFADGTDSLMDVPKDFLSRRFSVRRVRDEPLGPEPS